MKDAIAKHAQDFRISKKDGPIARILDEVFIRAMLWFALSATFLGLISQFNTINNDLFHEIALFREIMKTGSFLKEDIFAYVPTINPVVHHEWGTGALIYLLIIKPGLGGNALLLLKYFITIFICMGVYIFAKRRGASDYSFIAVTFIAIYLGQTGFTTIRAQLFTLMLLVIFLFLIEENREGKFWPLLALLPLYVCWVNLHGGFLICLGLFGVYIFELFLTSFLVSKSIKISFNHIKYQLIILILMCFSTLINPYGISYITYVWHAVALDRTLFIKEWRPIWQVCPNTFCIFLLSIILMAYLWNQEKKFILLPGTFLLIATAWQALWHYRHLTIYAIIFVCYVPPLLEKSNLCNLIKQSTRRFTIIFSVISIIIGLSGINMASSNKIWQLRIPSAHDKFNKNVVIYPVGPVRYLKDVNFTGNVMVHFNVGAYVSWNLFPQIKVSMDSRFEVAYPFNQVEENLNFYAGKEGWENTLSRYPTDAVLVPRWSPIFERDNAKELLAWDKVYIDDDYSIYMRSELAIKYPYIDMRGETIVGSFP